MEIDAIIFSGLLGSIVMFVLMELITRSKLANADMVRAVGSLLTRREENSFLYGLMLHVGAGLAFSLLYCYILSRIPIENIAIGGAIGAFGGFVHGFIVSYFLLIEISERHPLQRFRKAGFEVAIAHIIGHIAFGWSVGYMYSLQTATIGAASTALGVGSIYLMAAGCMVITALVYLSIRNQLRLLRN